jgi:tetratricopeptide (TPR) repeat protein
MKIFACIILFSWPLLFTAQNPALTIAEADELFASSRYSEAFPAYCELLKKDPLNAQINYKIGLCYLKSRSLKTRAQSFLEKAIELTPALTHNADPKNTDAPLITKKLIGDAYC